MKAVIDVIKGPHEWVIALSDNTVFLIRHALRSGTDSPLSPHEECIALLCEEIDHKQKYYAQFTLTPKANEGSANVGRSE